MRMVVYPPESPRHIFLVGGTDTQRQVSCLDLATLNFSELPSMNEKRCFVSTVVLGDGVILAIGGHNGRRRLKSVEKYDPQENRWNFVSPMNEVRSDAAAAMVHDSKVFVGGGFNGQRILSSFECYKPKTDKWTSLPEMTMTTPKSGFQLVTVGQCLYSLGGFNGQTRLSTCEKYNLVSKEWSTIASMSLGRSNFASVAVGEKIIVSTHILCMHIKISTKKEIYFS
jgi:N-acetylneuraminic acid mutarotase